MKSPRAPHHLDFFAFEIIIVLALISLPDLLLSDYVSLPLVLRRSSLVQIKIPGALGFQPGIPGAGRAVHCDVGPVAGTAQCLGTACGDRLPELGDPAAGEQDRADHLHHRLPPADRCGGAAEGHLRIMAD